jgi:hypothetical protein
MLRVPADGVNWFAAAPSGSLLDNSERDFSSRFFWSATENKIQIFSCRLRMRFLISSRWQGAKSAGVNKM